MPILIPLVAWVVLHQNIPRGLWLAIAIGFAGLVVVVKSSTTTIGQPGDLLALSAALSGAIEFLIVRRLNQSKVQDVSMLSSAISVLMKLEIQFLDDRRIGNDRYNSRIRLSRDRDFIGTWSQIVQLITTISFGDGRWRKANCR
jgi:hypothetical protein